MDKKRLNVSLDCDLANFAKIYVQENKTTVSELITQFLLSLKRNSEGAGMEIIYSNPDFHKSIKDVQSKLRKGTAKWHTFEEVFEA